MIGPQDDGLAVDHGAFDRFARFRLNAEAALVLSRPLLRLLWGAVRVPLDQGNSNVDRTQALFPQTIPNHGTRRDPSGFEKAAPGRTLAGRGCAGMGLRR